MVNTFQPRYSVAVTDALSCRLASSGTTLCTLDFSGVASYKEIYRYIAQKAGDIKGLVTLHLRNKSQGWSESMALRMI